MAMALGTKPGFEECGGGDSSGGEGGREMADLGKAGGLRGAKGRARA